MFGYECAKCSQKRLTSYRAIHNDNTNDDINTAAGGAQAPVKPTQLPEIQTFFRPGYPIYIGDCDSSVKKDLNCGNNPKTSNNGKTAEQSVKLFKNQDSLSTPEHEDDVCNTCSKPLRTFSSDSGDELFIQKGNVLYHQGEKYFTCTTCAKIFPKKAQPTTHMRIHTGEKPYSCKTCGKSFSQQTTLKSHIRIHTGEKPYLCTICGKQYGHSSTLIRHKKNQH